MTSEHLNSESAAAKLNITVDQLSALREEGLISAEQINDEWHYSLSSLEAYLSQHAADLPAATEPDSELDTAGQSELASEMAKESQSSTRRLQKPDFDSESASDEQSELASEMTQESQSSTRRLQKPDLDEDSPDAESEDSDSFPKKITEPGAIDSAIFQAPESAELDALDGIDSSQFEQPDSPSRLSDEYREMSPEAEETFDASAGESDIFSDVGNDDSALILGEESGVDSDGATMIHSSQDLADSMAEDFDSQQLDVDDESGIELSSDSAEEESDDDDSGITLESSSEVEALEDSGLTLAGSGVIADEASAIVLDGDDSVVVDGENVSGIQLDEDSGITLDEDSGIALEMTSILEEDSDPNLADDDSGIALEAIEDSGIALEEAMVVDDDDDSGIALLAEDSGIALEAATDSDIEAEGTMRMVSPHADSDIDELELEALEEDVEMDGTSRLENPFEQESDFASLEDSASDVQLSDSPVSEELEIMDESGEFDEFAEEGMDLEEPEFFDDAGDLLDQDELSGEFGMETSGASSVEMQLAPAAKQTFVQPPQAEWGAMAFVGLLASVLILVANGVVAWQGLRTLNTGDVKPAVTDSLVEMILNLF